MESGKLLDRLKQLGAEWLASVGNLEDPPNSRELSRRERLKIITTQVAIIRLLQSESRLNYQLLLALGGVASGSLATLLFQ